MHKIDLKLILTMCMAFFYTCVTAQERSSVGSFHSPKGFGICYDKWLEPDIFRTYVLYADTFGIFNGKHSSAGVKFSYNHDYVFKTIKRGESDVFLFWGPGLVTGYARDIKSGKSLIYGFNFNIGAQYSFLSSQANITLEAASDLAFKAIKKNNSSDIKISIYKSGIYHIFYPQLKIQFRFK